MSGKRAKAQRRAEQEAALRNAPPALPPALGADEMLRRAKFRLPDWARMPPRRRRVALVPLTLTPPTGGAP